MFPEDRVLVGVVNRKQDWLRVQKEHWYRIPQSRVSEGVPVEYLAFFCSKPIFPTSGIYYYATRRGVELVRRQDLLPNEKRRANDLYYKVQLGDLTATRQSIVNDRKRVVTFITTTWDRFVNAQTINDLYSKADHFVDRVYYALHDKGIRTERMWAAELRENAARIKVMCQDGLLVASTKQAADMFFLDEQLPEDQLLAQFKAEIAKMGGPVFISIPTEHYS